MSMMETSFSRIGATNPVGASPASFEVWQAFVAPGDVFRHPREVLDHPDLTSGDKRAILASWASDARALENAPTLRCLVGSRAEPVSVDAVLSALTELDRTSVPVDTAAMPPPSRMTQPRPRRLRRLRRLHRYVRPGRRDDDDDPPPGPAMAMPRPISPRSASLAAALPA
jgi:hypothetical protein